MQDRYEIRGKLGQGGLGAVYRAYDKTLKREVAIKRISTSDDEPHNEEATKQMTQETGALAALQHPHIVTIYDVGTDDEGPFVVMELLKGKTIDEIVEETAPLTWKDFREFTMQVQEGLIAAQDLNLVHRDLKPSNLMLNWLPSGKFQVKIVDFGLARFAAEPVFQEVTEGDAVYGSIFFMAPEQFERKKIDTRTDMYAIGCVYYFALTGTMPFQGETGPQVMAAHLEHRIVPLSDLRPDIPAWVNDWVMWHINRMPEDRPENTREALENFIQLDTPENEAVTSETEPVPATPPRPRLLVPGSEPVAPAPVAPSPTADERPSPPVTQSIPQPLKPPEDAPPSLHTTSQQASAATAAEAAPDAPPPAASVIPTVQLKAGAAAPTAQAVPTAQAAPTAQAEPAATNPPGGFGHTSIGSGSDQKKGLSSSAKTAIFSVLGLLILLVGWMLMTAMKDNKINKRYNELVEITAMPTTRELPVTQADLEILLGSIGTGANKTRETVYKALWIAKTTDGSDADELIAEFATQDVLNDDIRIALLSRVLRKRANPSSLYPLLEYSKNTENELVAAAALTAVTDIAGDEQIDDFIDVMKYTPSNNIRKAAEGALEGILARSAHREKWADVIAETLAESTDDSIRRSMIRLLGIAGGDKAKEVLEEVLEGDNKLDQLATIEAMKSWPDDSMFIPLMDFLSMQSDDTVRPKAFSAGYVFLMDDKRERSEEDTEKFWRILAENAKTPKEQDTMISGLVSIATSEWPIEVIQGFADTSKNDRVIDRSEQGIIRIKERLEILQGSKQKFNEDE
ncbi:protein kinase domain-containing protein [Haloferula sp.]|uniref:serine/threonine protein kinase n=1 Tax=Haloferula sp. TaxID=2497595 RepID=UPI00329B982A